MTATASPSPHLATEMITFPRSFQLFQCVARYLVIFLFRTRLENEKPPGQIQRMIKELSKYNKGGIVKLLEKVLYE